MTRNGHHCSPANGRVFCAHPIGESHEMRAVADVADRAQHERGAEHQPADAVDDPGVLGHLRGDERDRGEEAGRAA